MYQDFRFLRITEEHADTTHDPKRGPAVVPPPSSTTRSTSVVPTDESSGKCAATKDDLSPGARGLYDLIVGASAFPE
jgi:hypothetical protein